MKKRSSPISSLVFSKLYNYRKGGKGEEGEVLYFPQEEGLFSFLAGGGGKGGGEELN